MAARSFLRSRTFLPLSKTIGLKPFSINFNAANKPAGPAPTIMISCAFVTFLKLGNSIFFSLKSS